MITITTAWVIDFILHAVVIFGTLAAFAACALGLGILFVKWVEGDFSAETRELNKYLNDRG